MYVRNESHVGRKYNRLTILEEYYSRERNGKSVIMAKCQCDCGKILHVRRNSVTRGHTASCGCLKDETFKQMTLETRHKHDMSNTRIYSIYHGMNNRCDNPNTVGYINYGGRGITVCPEWNRSNPNGFMNFYTWAMQNGYRDDLSIDRMDVNGNYEPSNCRWITMAEQNSNTRKSRFINYNGGKLNITSIDPLLRMGSRGTVANRLNKYPENEAEIVHNFFVSSPDRDPDSIKPFHFAYSDGTIDPLIGQPKKEYVPRGNVERVKIDYNGKECTTNDIVDLLDISAGRFREELRKHPGEEDTVVKNNLPSSPDRVGAIRPLSFMYKDQSVKEAMKIINIRNGMRTEDGIVKSRYNREEYINEDQNKEDQDNTNNIND